MSSHICIVAGKTAERALGRLNGDLSKVSAEHRLLDTAFKAVFDVSKAPMELVTYWFPEGVLQEPGGAGLYSLESLETAIRRRVTSILNIYPDLVGSDGWFIAIGRIRS